MKDFILETDLEDKLKALDADKGVFVKQRITYTMVFALLGLIVAGLLSFLLGAVGVAIGLPIMLLSLFGGWKYMYFVANKKYALHKKQLTLLFPDFLTTFISLLNSSASGNVINTLEQTIPYVKNPLKMHILGLVRKVFEDPSHENVWNAFNQFADEIEDKEAEQIMALVSDMYTAGVNKEALKELEDRINEMKQNQVKEYAKKKNLRLKNVASLPTLGLATLYVFVWAGTIAFHYGSMALGGINL